MKPLVDIVTLLKQKLAEGTAAEQRLAGVILADIETASRYSIAELAEKASVSEPSVTRLATSVGLEGTRELKISLAQAVAISGSYLDNDKRGDESNDTPSVIARYAAKAIDEAARSIDDETLDSIAGALAKCKAVQVLGTGGMSSMAAQLLEFRLFRMGLHISAPIDGRLQRMNAALANSDTVVVGFSLSGDASSVIDSINIAKRYGAQTFAVAPADSALARSADTVIAYRYNEDGHIYKPNSANFAYMTIVDTIALKTAEIMGPKVIENLRRIKQTLTIADTYDATLPLGD